ncbi:MAG: hypothetical protein IJM59_03375 [Proteobacteria bacterium]|nr:hypothetical protein [Pseudomonadota bacterium]
MAVCLVCSKKSHQLGELCSCGGGYTVHDQHGEDSLHLLGKLIVNKIVPTAVISETNELIQYDAFQPSIDRTIAFIVVKPIVNNDPARRARLFSVVDKCAAIKQQNTPNILEIIDLPDLRCSSMTLEPIKGERLNEYMNTHPLDPVSLMHIIHQILQAVSAHHQAGICFPGIRAENVRISRSGSDRVFVKLTDLFSLTCQHDSEQNSFSDDVFNIGQMALSLITGQSLPITQIELPRDRSFLMPIAQLFSKAIAPKEERFESCTELLQAFETAFDLNTHENERPEVITSVSNKKVSKHQTPVPFEQVIWMHRPPQPMS